MVVDRSRRRRIPRADLFSWRRLLLRFDCQPSPIGNRGRTGRSLRTLAPRVQCGLRASVSGRARDDALDRSVRLRVARATRRITIAVGGDSAGANLTLALVGELKRMGEDLPGALWLLSPWVDLTEWARRLHARRRSAHSERISGGPDGRLRPGWDGPE